MKWGDLVCHLCQWPAAPWPEDPFVFPPRDEWGRDLHGDVLAMALLIRHYFNRHEIGFSTCPICPEFCSGWYCGAAEHLIKHHSPKQLASALILKELGR